MSFGEAEEIPPPAAGTYTRLPAPGDVVKAGEELYRIDEQAVYAMPGKVPVYRVLEYGAEGRDVRQLKDELRELGYELASDDDEFDWETRQAVLQWQSDHGREQTGRLGKEDITFLPAEVRVDEVLARTGDTGDAVPFTFTGNAPLVSASLTADQARRLAAGVGDRVTLAVDGEEVPGAVDAVVAAEDGSATVFASSTTTDVPAGASVELSTVGETRTDVLIVPVVAVVVSADGHAVSVLRDDEIVDVPVVLGLLADGDVEITSDDISEGDLVVVPS
ncbi:peptidoglycan-binding domain-containing protein [Isoptericola halotolerans]|uniref:peptidoglycan-binding protein n=1 Tax=Isoptericola halotolerans TaxID=300560 RepID=UPI0038903D2F